MRVNVTFDRPVAARVLLGFAVCVGLIAVLTAVAVNTISAPQNSVRTIMQTIPSTRETRDSVLQVVALESALRGYVATGDRRFILETDVARTHLDMDLTALKIYSNNHEIFQRWVADAQPQLMAIEAALDKELAAIKRGDHASAVAGLLPLKQMVDQYQLVGPYIDDGSIGSPALLSGQFNALLAVQAQQRTFLITVGAIAALIVAVWGIALSNSLAKSPA
jgi:hypothetical protein